MIKKTMAVSQGSAGQRVDNFLLGLLKGVPKSRVYRGLRKGEFRVNEARVPPNYRLCVNDRLQMPLLRVAERQKSSLPPPSHWLTLLESQILYEDQYIMAINKPSGMAVHGGSKISWGLIELLRQLRTKSNQLELIHRLDRDTSGCLLIAKQRAALLEWHHLLVHRQVKKHYTLLVKGRWDLKKQKVTLALKKNVLQSGERIVTADSLGKPAKTHFQVLKTFQNATLLLASPVTGRTHQIRVHAAAMGHPIAGDEKYGDQHFNRQMRDIGLKRLFLHCTKMERIHKTSRGFQGISAPLEADLCQLIKCKTNRNSEGYFNACVNWKNIAI